MSKFAQAMNASAYTWNGALSYASPDPSGEVSGRLSLFFKGVRGLNVPRLYSYLRDCSRESITDTFLLAFHLRDCRGGKGERELGRKALGWLFINFPVQFRQIMRLIPDYGRWDDLLELFPGALPLTSLEFVRENFSSVVPDEAYLNNLRALQNEVVQIVASQLKQDRENMLAGKPCSLCAKWTPTEGDSQDRKTGVFKTLATAVGVSSRNLRRNYNTPLRAYLKIVEGYMCTGRWNEIEFSKVPSHAMKRLKSAFEKHDSERFTNWRTLLSKGEVKVNAKQLQPHELVREIVVRGGADAVVEAQWKVLVEEVRRLGSLKDAVVVCDVSGSMTCNNSIPLHVSIGLGLIISEVVNGPFHGQVITFHETPSFCVLPKADLATRCRTIQQMPWGGCTNLEGTFRLILNRAKECNLRQEDMPKKLFIISDMQFNSATNRSQTNMERINEMYKQSGYTRPQIIFWNVNGMSTDFPVTKDENNTAMISGFSPAILKAILKGEEYSPEVVMRNALDDERYVPVRKSLAGEEDFEVL